jgi:hypothetical protein
MRKGSGETRSTSPLAGANATGIKGERPGRSVKTRPLWLAAAVNTTPR